MSAGDSALVDPSLAVDALSSNAGGGSGMIDLNNPDSYTVQDFGGGNILYTDRSTGLSYDPNDLSTPLSATDVASYGAAVNQPGAISPVSGGQSSQSSFHAPASTGTVNSPSSGGLNTAGLSGMFTAVGSAFATVLNPPKNTAGGQPLVYDAVRGTYIPATAAGQSVTNLTSIPMWLVIGAVVVVVGIVFLREKK